MNWISNTHLLFKKNSFPNYFLLLTVFMYTLTYNFESLLKIQDSVNINQFIFVFFLAFFNYNFSKLHKLFLNTLTIIVTLIFMHFQSILIGEFIPQQYDNYFWIFNESKKVDFKLTTVVFFYQKYAHSNNLEWAKYTKQINSDLIFWLTWHWGPIHHWPCKNVCTMY